jgi:putative pyruvate formate lyase activating enzyme
MSQFTPISAVKHHPLLGRRVTRQEYQVVVDHALALGFENLYLQEVNDRHLSPDFGQEKPFCWD